MKLKTEEKTCLPAQTKVVSKRINAIAQWLNTHFTVRSMCFSVRERVPYGYSEGPVLQKAPRWKIQCRHGNYGNNSEVVITIATQCIGWGLGVEINQNFQTFGGKQRRFLEKFTIGKTTGKKLDPVTVARQMRVTRGSDGKRQFTPEELLTANQIQGFFSSRAKSKNQAVVEVQ